MPIPKPSQEARDTMIKNAVKSAEKVLYCTYTSMKFNPQLIEHEIYKLQDFF